MVRLTIAPSLGGTLAMNMICQKRLRTKNLITIGSSHGSKEESLMNNFLIPPIEVSFLKATLDNFWAVCSYDDPGTHHEYSSLLVKQAGAVGLFYSDQGHFEADRLPQEVLLLIEHSLP